MNECEVVKEACLLNDLNTDFFLLRYVKPSHINDFIATDESLQLRDDRPPAPPEEYLSFFYSSSDSTTKRCSDVMNILASKPKPFICKKTGGFLELNANEVNDNVNTTRKVVEIKPYGHPHYGLHFCSNKQEDILEAKTVLLYIAGFELISNIF